MIALAYLATLAVYVGVGALLFTAANAEPNSTPRAALLDEASWPVLAIRRFWRD